MEFKSSPWQKAESCDQVHEVAYPKSDDAYARTVNHVRTSLRIATTIPASRETVFSFFSDASNLMRLTPPSLGFKILTPVPIACRKERSSTTRFCFAGCQCAGGRRICRWNPPFEFIDEQLKGPYRKWIHHHTFEEMDSGKTLMRDRVRFALPFPPFGDIALPFVRAEVRGIFEFRRKAIWRRRTLTRKSHETSPSSLEPLAHEGFRTPCPKRISDTWSGT